MHDRLTFFAHVDWASVSLGVGLVVLLFLAVCGVPETSVTGNNCLTFEDFPVRHIHENGLGSVGCEVMRRDMVSCHAVYRPRKPLASNVS